MHHMHLLRLLPFLFVITLDRPVVAQKGAPADTSLARVLDAYLLACQRKDVPFIMDHVHPEVFKVMPKAALTETMEKSMNDPEFPTAIDTVVLLRSKGPLVSDGITYYAITYENHMRMHAFPETGADGATVDAAEQAGTDRTMLALFQLTYGKDNVHFDPETRDYRMTSKSTMFAVLDPSLDGWKFITYKAGMEVLMDRIVPERVRRKLSVK